MLLFIDSSDKKSIDEYQELGIIDGCTTNPKIMANEGVEDWRRKLKELSKLVDGPISGEVTTNNKDEIVRQAKEINSIGENVNVKIPANKPGFEAISELEDVSVNMTACMSVNQVLMAEKAGADYASIFMGRISDMGSDPIKVIEESSELVEDIEIIIGSIRKVHDIQEAFLAGADIVTVPPKFIEEMIEHRKTEEIVEEFMEA